MGVQVLVDQLGRDVPSLRRNAGWRPRQWPPGRGQQSGKSPSRRRSEADPAGTRAQASMFAPHERGLKTALDPNEERMKR
jgi:hypothetical protein